VPEDFHEFFSARVLPVLADAGGQIVGLLHTEYSENTFPQLPVRTGEHVFVCITRFDDAQHHAVHTNRLAESDHWLGALQEMQKWLFAPLEQLTLTPTARSLMR
jgi:hypothetical protein